MDVHQQVLMDVAIILELGWVISTLGTILLNKIGVVPLLFLKREALEVLSDAAMESVGNITILFPLHLLHPLHQGLIDKL